MTESLEFYRHMPVRLANGRRLGRTEEIGHAVDFIHVQQGTVVIRDWYIPMEAVSTVDESGVRLRCDRAELRRRGWGVPPEAFLYRQGATHGYEYTGPADVPRYTEEAPGKTTTVATEEEA